MSYDLEVSSFMRVASISVAAYDYLVTIPVELRVYSSITELNFGWTVSVVLFILLRYISIVLLTVSHVGWFYHGFSAKACARYYLVAPVFKVVQIIISQVIIGYRTWNISQRSRGMGIFLLVLGFVTSFLEAFSNLDSRTHSNEDGNCPPENGDSRIPQWVFYLLSTLFNAITIVISSFFLINSASSISRMSSILRTLFYDGLGYVVALTAVNTMNMILYRNGAGTGTSLDGRRRASGASFGFMMVWIMSQRFLIHVHEAAEVRAQRELGFGPNGRIVRRSEMDGENGDINLKVQVQIEQAVMVDYDVKTKRKSKQDV